MDSNFKIIRTLVNKAIRLLLLCFCFGVIISCSSDDEFINSSSGITNLEKVASKDDYSNEENLSQYKASVARLPTESPLNNVALDYVNNTKTLIYASEALEVPPALNIDENSEDVNPMALKLQALEIEDDETGDKINFYDLPMVQKEIFVDNLLQKEAVDIAEKLKRVPQAANDLALENKATYKTIRELELTELRIGDEPILAASYSRSVNQDTPSIKKVGAKKLFKKLQENITEETSKNYEERGVGVSFNYPKVPVERVKRMWRWYARRGDFIVALPNHYNPWTYVNVGSNVKFKVGHAGIINKKITYSTDEDEYVTIECHTDGGVKEKSISYWDTPHYIMGIRRIVWKWRWRGFRSGLYRIFKPVGNPWTLADKAQNYMGRDYVRWYEFATAKWAAPSRFTCTTLVWWCAKKAYRVNVSCWYSTLVTPSRLLTDNNTYVRAVVQ